MNDFYSTFYFGTILFLILSGSIIIIFFFHQKEKLKLLRESEKKYSDLFHNVSDIIYIHTLDGDFLEINKSASQLLDYSRQDIIGKNLRYFVKEIYHSGIEEYLNKFRNGTEELLGTAILFSKDKKKLYILEYKSSIVLDESGNRMAVRGIARDVTEQRRSERALVKSNYKAKRLLDEALVMQKNLDQISRELIRTHEEACGRISRELHDEVGQMLTSVTLNLKILGNNHSNDQVQIQKIINDTKSLTDQIFLKIRSYLRELRPAALDSLGLIPAVRQLANQFSERTGVIVSMPGDESIDCLDGEQKTVLYRIVQESLTNVAKYAQAQAVTIMFDKHDNNVVLEIDDDGKGFNPENIKINQLERKNLGILGMQERARLINGKFYIRSEEGIGTSIRVEIPIQSSIEKPVP
ncbi:MAG: PAS domain-containing sensor histidine kinase [Ignavibacteriales bacterium]|nr:PAS domain-containing sensor histidine kinase [Ignavibacteriales bacterium]